VLAERLEVIRERRSTEQDTGRPHRRSA